MHLKMSSTNVNHLVSALICYRRVSEQECPNLVCHAFNSSRWVHFRRFENIFSFLSLFNTADSTASWNPCVWKTRTYLRCIVLTMSADDLATQGARASAVMVWHRSPEMFRFQDLWVNCYRKAYKTSLLLQSQQTQWFCFDSVMPNTSVWVLQMVELIAGHLCYFALWKLREKFRHVMNCMNSRF